MIPGNSLVFDLAAGPPVDSGDELELLLLLVVGFVAGVYLLYDGLRNCY
jgi:hypothetical protein